MLSVEKRQTGKLKLITMNKGKNRVFGKLQGCRIRGTDEKVRVRDRVRVRVGVGVTVRVRVTDRVVKVDYN